MVVENIVPRHVTTVVCEKGKSSNAILVTKKFISLEKHLTVQKVRDTFVLNRARQSGEILSLLVKSTLTG
jgi:hypothetical protein